MTDQDLKFYERVSPVIKGKRILISPPSLCPRERMRRRMAFRNERNLYHTKSAMSGETILSMYHPDTPYPVYTKDELMNNKWDPLIYGQEIDFGRSFFEQFDEVLKKIPRTNLAIFINNENSEYCNYVGDIKNSYLCFGSIFIEDCMYGNPYYSKNCIDCFLVRKSELCYECIDSQELYHCVHVQDCYNCSDCFDCFQISDSEDCLYNIQTVENKDCHDMNYTEENELCYEYLGNYRNNLACFCLLPYGCHDIWYTSMCFNCNDIFGCIGLKQKKFCILNKQYPESEYRDLLGRIFNHMRETGELSEFFPIEKLPYAYNETVAMEYFPMSREEVLERGWKWREKDEREYPEQDFEVMNNIREVDDEILDAVLACNKCGKNYRVIEVELKFYRKHGLQVPLYCPECRNRARMGMRNGRKIFDRTCDKCGLSVETTYDGNFAGKVYCEKCYLGEVY